MLRYPKYGLLWSLSRFGLVLTVLFIAPCIVALALAPMLLMLLPLALIAMPFMVCAFFSSAADHRHATRRIRAWRPIAARAV